MERSASTVYPARAGEDDEERRCIPERLTEPGDRNQGGNTSQQRAGSPNGASPGASARVDPKPPRRTPPTAVRAIFTTPPTSSKNSRSRGTQVRTPGTIQTISADTGTIRRIGVQQDGLGDRRRKRVDTKDDRVQETEGEAVSGPGTLSGNRRPSGRPAGPGGRARPPGAAVPPGPAAVQTRRGVKHLQPLGATVPA